MTPEEWQEVKVLLAEALELPASQRASFLDSRCHDPALRSELDALLEASEDDGFLDGEPTLPRPMAPALGEVLGPYRIEKKLGEGGMGEVYQALDSRLGRRVAVKVLPPRLSQNASALKRFERETKALAALSHPNILAIFDVGRHGGTAFAVTELLTGATLRERLERGRLPVATAVDVAAQAARGLAVAHAEGVVHRDLKPENLFVTAGGTVKVLDFGIAAFTPLWGGAGEESRLTVENSVIGTARYMSPEQAKGQTCDHRSDIFSLGAVLYEMLTGSPAFPGEAPIDAIFAVIEQDPVPLETLCPAASPQLARLVHRCLDKDPARRFQSASDLAFHLESLTTAAAAQAVTAPSVPPVGRRRGLLRAGALAGLLLAVAFLAGLLVQRRWGQNEPPSFQRLTFRRGKVISARFAPDGRTIVYSAAWDGDWVQLFTTRTDSPESRPLGLPPAVLYSISSRSELLVGLLQIRGGTLIGETLARLPLAGGAPRPLLEEGQPTWFDWAPDAETFAMLRNVPEGVQVEYPRGQSIWRSENDAWDMRLAPAGDALAFCEARGSSEQVVMMIDRAGKVMAQSGGWHLSSMIGRLPRGCVAWAQDGKEVWFAAARPGGRDSGLYALTRNGEVRPLLRVPGELTLQDIAPDGGVLITHFNRGVALLARKPGETKDRDLSWFETSELADLSLDGRWILFTESGQGGGERLSVYLRSTDGSPAVRLGDGKALALSPDGRWALVRSATDPKRLSLLPTGAGEPRALPAAPMDVFEARWRPGSNQLLVSGTEPGKGNRLYTMDIGAKEAHPFTRIGTWFFVPSPDGSRVATWGVEGAKIYRIGGGEPHAVPGVGVTPPEMPIQWRADGRALYMGRFVEEGFRIDEVDLATGRRLPWKELTPPDPINRGFRTVRMTPDGKAYAFDIMNSMPTLYLVRGLR